MPTDGNFTLRDAFERLEKLSGWAPATTGAYRSLLRQWEARHDGERGPNLRDVTEDQWVEFLVSVKSWATPQTRAKHAANLQKLLCSVGARTPAAKYGMAPGTEVLAQVPVLVLPQQVKERSTTLVWRFRTIDVESIGKLYDAATRLPGLERVRWQGLLALLWFCGPRRTDALLMPWEAVDFRTRTLAYIESKKQHPVGPLPLPGWMLTHLRALEKAGFGETLFGFTPSDITNACDSIYPTLYRLYRQAGVDVLTSSAGSRRQPFHGLRSACITNWRAYEPALQKFITGHSLGSDVSAGSYDRVGQRLKRAVEKLPIPDNFKGQRRVRRRLPAAA